MILVSLNFRADPKFLGFFTIMTAESLHSQTTENKGSSEMSHLEMADGVRVEVLQGSMALDLAKRTDPPNPWSRSMLRLYGFLAVGYLCSALNGRSEK